MSANSASKTHGMVSSDGPASQAKPSRVTRAHLPPGAGPASNTRTRWPSAASRIAAASPPTPAPTTAILIPGSASGDHPRPRESVDPGRSRRSSAGTAKAPIAAAPAAATRGRRHSAALATVSPTHVQA